MEYLFRSKDGYQFFKEKKEGITAEIDTLSKTELDSSNDSLKIILKAKHTLRLIVDWVQKDPEVISKEVLSRFEKIFEQVNSILDE